MDAPVVAVVVDALVVDALVVDMANVVGSRPDGWWRDRAGAAERLAAQLAAALDAGAFDTGALTAATLHLVLEGAARTAAPPPHPRLQVHRAAHDGDDAIVELVAALVGGAVADGAVADGVAVVTADRGLRERVRAVGADVVGPRAILDVLRKGPADGERASAHDQHRTSGR